jgi:hypothetical protein
MAWIYLSHSTNSASSLGSQDQPLLWHPSAGQSPIARATSPRKTIYLSSNKKERSRLRLSGTTYELSDADTSESLWTSLAADGPARILALRELERAWEESDRALSLKSSDSFASSSPDSSSWKTHQWSLFQGLTEYSWSSMRWGMMRAGQLFQPKRWAPRTSGNDCGFLPTPTATPYGSNQSPSEGAKVRGSLDTLARRRLPTPLASDGAHGGPSANNHGAPKLTALAIRMPTPLARDGKDGLTPKRHGRNSPSVAVAVAESGHHGYLNPALVEVIMGYPIGWTVYTDWGTHGCLKSRERLS